VRIERVGKTSEVSMLYRVAAPVFGALGWKPVLSAEAMQKLVKTFREHPRAKGDKLERRFSAALNELEENTTNVERLAAIRKRAPIGHASWLARMHAILVRAEGALEPVDEEEREELAELVADTDELAVAPPLARVRTSEPVAKGESSQERANEPERLVELELAAVDHLLRAGAEEREVLSRRRRLFEAARQVLLDASAALPLEKEGVEARKRAILVEIMRLDRLQARGVDFEVGLVHQARTAVSRGEEERLRAVVAALDHVARSSGDAGLARLTRRAVHRVFGDVRTLGDEARRDSLERSAEECLGADVCALVKGAYESALRERKSREGRRDDVLREDVLRAELDYLATGADTATLTATLAVDGAFDLGGVLSPVRVVTEHRVTRRVPFPAPALSLVAAESVEDLTDALIEDPRTLVLQLATGRLLARRYVREEIKRTTRVVMASEVRVFLLDGSGSMLGPRARVRDAMLVAELATLGRRLIERRDVRTSLFFAYFTDSVGPVVRVDNPRAVESAIREVIGNVRVGGTDIQSALIAAFELVGKARGSDKELSKAQVVLVTDGEAAVDEAAVVAAREVAGGDVPVGVSVVALGMENPALRGLVARQRAKGERAFYHFVDDAMLKTMVDGELDRGLPLHVPSMHLGDARAVAAALEESVGVVVTELEDLARSRDLEAIERLDDERHALREVGLDEVEIAASTHEGERARVEALGKDAAALERRFLRWFPDPKTIEGGLSVVQDDGLADVEAVVVMLSSIVEVVRLVGGTELSRRADAIDLVERLLPDAGLSPSRYFATIAAHGSRVAPVLEAMHSAVRPSPTSVREA
jgi:hypothetical protein